MVVGLRMRSQIFAGFCCLFLLSVILTSAAGDEQARPAAARTSEPAANPRLSLTIEQASLTDAAAALSKVSGIDIRPSGRSSGPAGGDPPKASFHWANVTVFDALRQLCDAFHVSCRREPLGYRLEPMHENREPHRAAGSIWMDRKPGVTVRALGAAWDRREPVAPPADGSFREAATVALELEFDRMDAGRAIGVANVAAEDDRGNLLTFREPPTPQEASPYANRWFGDVEFPYADPRARKLSWLQGDLLVYRNVLESRAVIPFQTDHAIPVRFAKWEGEIDCTQTSSPKPALPFGGLGGGLGGGPQANGPRVTVRLHTELATDNSRNQNQVSVELVGKSGTTYLPQGAQWSAGSHEIESQSYFRPVGEPIAEARVGFRAMSGISRLVTFRLTNVAFPGHLSLPRSSGPDPRDAQPSHGEITFAVVGNGSAVPGGSVTVGLRARQANGWSPIRWRQVELDEHGHARISDLPPGSYQILRHYRSPKPLPPGGHWAAETVIATVGAGKSTTLPPLRWVSPR